MKLQELYLQLVEQQMSLVDIFEKYYKEKIIQRLDGKGDPKTYFMLFVEADPTSLKNKKGKYLDWLLNLWFNMKLKTEDLYKAKEYLTKFEELKSVLKKDGKNIDINKYKSLPELYRLIASYLEKQEEELLSNTQLIKQIKENETQKFYEDSNWLVVIPKTERAACLYGKGTQWCTAAEKSDNMFSYYTNSDIYGNANLYVIINKQTKEKYQVHLQSGQFMDVHDEQMIFPHEILPSKLLFAMLKNEQPICLKTDCFTFNIKNNRADVVPHTDEIRDVISHLFGEHSKSIDLILKSKKPWVHINVIDPPIDYNVYDSYSFGEIDKLYVNIPKAKKQIVNTLKKDGFFTNENFDTLSLNPMGLIAFLCLNQDNYFNDEGLEITFGRACFSSKIK